MPSREEWAQQFADAVKNLRMDSGLTVSAMAETMGVDERTYRKYERGIASPQVIDYCALMDRLDAPVLRPLLRFLHPDVFADEADLQQMTGELEFYLRSVAPERIVRQVHRNLIGQVSDNTAPQLELVSALQHMPLIYRVMVSKLVLSLWELAEDRGELLHMDQLPPDIDALRQATEAAEKACRQMKERYSTISAER